MCDALWPMDVFDACLCAIIGVTDDVVGKRGICRALGAARRGAARALRAACRPFARCCGGGAAGVLQ